jgi:hypothetical protein
MRDRKDVSSNEVSQMSNGISATGTCHEGHPLKHVKGFSSLSPNMPKLVKQPEEMQTQSHHQGCNRPGSCPSLEEEDIDNPVIPSLNANSSPKDNMLLGSAKYPTLHPAGDKLDSAPESQQISQVSKLFLSIDNMDNSLELNPTAVGQFSLENFTDFGLLKKRSVGTGLIGSKISWHRTCRLWNMTGLGSQMHQQPLHISAQVQIPFWIPIILSPSSKT